MTVSWDHVAALRAALDGDEEIFERLAAPADFLDGEGFSVLVGAAFSLAARRRFPPGWSTGDVVRFVGRLRARNGGAVVDVNAAVAEQMLFGVSRGKLMPPEFDENTKGIAQFSVLAELVSDLDEQDHRTFLAGAREQADAWLLGAPSLSAWHYSQVSAMQCGNWQERQAMTTPAIDKAVTMTRALITDDMDTYRRLNAGLNSDETHAFVTVFTAALYEAANDKFGKNHTVADVIEFVAEARAQYVGTETVSAEDAELVIREVLGEDGLTDSMSTDTRGQAQTAMLIAIVRDSELSSAEIDDLLDAAAQQARSFFGRQGGR